MANKELIQQTLDNIPDDLQLGRGRLYDYGTHEHCAVGYLCMAAGNESYYSDGIRPTFSHYGISDEQAQLLVSQNDDAVTSNRRVYLLKKHLNNWLAS